MYYKVLTADGKPCYGGVGQWHLANGQPGEWMPEIADIKPCERGYHLCERGQLIHWLRGPTIWEAEGRGDFIRQDDKVVFAQARLLRPLPAWNERTARLFACDCAERVLPIYAKCCPNDRRQANCIAVARRFANGEATHEELAAARAAAAVVAAYAAVAAARAAAFDAAFDAAWEAARAAAWDVAGDAAWDAAGEWQTERLFEYLKGKP